ncbi:MAG: cytochrome o ubiquinol oxidase subunit IV [Candidatus Pacebacteria bacterium]|nr:cytochrome o ubiquinol oxidase subunit IV [Candidatus Paceibacterota bacterium]
MKSFHAYLTGFILSILLTVVAFGLMHFHMKSDHAMPPHELMVPLLVFLAVAQFLIQLIFFLHLGQEERPRWNSIAFAFAAFIVIVIVGGSLWIMGNIEHGQSDLSEIYPSGEITPQGQDD